MIYTKRVLFTILIWGLQNGSPPRSAPTGTQYIYSCTRKVKLPGLIIFDRSLLEYILILLETSFVREMHWNVCPAQWKWCWRGTFCCVMVSWVLDWLNIWALNAALLWQMYVRSFEISIWLCRVNKNVQRLFWLQHQSCTERGTYLYKSVQTFKSVPLKKNSEFVIWSRERTFSSFVFTVLREIYAERKSYGVYIHFNKHRPKCNLDKCNGLKYVL